MMIVSLSQVHSMAFRFLSLPIEQANKSTSINAGPPICNH